MKQSNVIVICITVLLIGMLYIYAGMLSWTLWSFGCEAWRELPEIAASSFTETQQAMVAIVALSAILTLDALSQWLGFAAGGDRNLEASGLPRPRHTVSYLVTGGAVVGTLFCAISMMTDCINPVAYVFGNAGAYEMGERIFRLVRSRSEAENGDSLCSRRVCNTGTADGKKFQTIIEAVYGPHSREMAQEYSTLAGYSASGHDFGAAEFLYQRSANLFYHLHQDAASAEALGAVSWYQSLQGKSTSATVTLSRAATIISECPDNLDTLSALTWPLQAAQASGDSRQHKDFMNRAITIESKLKSHLI